MKTLLCSLCLFVAIVSSSSAALQVSSSAATNIQPTSAFFCGNLTATNGSTNAISIRLCYGSSDGLTNLTWWGYTNRLLSVASTGACSTNVTGLTPTTHYYYRWYATQGTNAAWSTPSTSFWTTARVPTSAPPAVAAYPVMADTNGDLASPTNFFDRNQIPRTGDIPSLETDPLSLHHTATYTSWTNAGGTYSNVGIVLTSPLLTNGISTLTYSAAGSMIVNTEFSLDGTNWAPLAATNVAAYVCLRLTNGIPPFEGGDYAAISNVVATSWSHPTLWQIPFDTAGQKLLVDDPTDERQAVNLRTLAGAITPTAPSAWSEYPATTNVNLNGHRLIMTAGWSVVQTAGVGIVSYADVFVTNNELTIAHDGIPVLSASSGLGGLHVSGFSVQGSNAVLWVSTNWVMSAPFPEYTADLLSPDWTVPGTWTSSYPVITNNAYRLDVTLPDGNQGFLRAVQQLNPASITINGNLNVEGVISACSTVLTYTALSVGELIVSNKTVLFATDSGSPKLTNINSIASDPDNGGGSISLEEQILKDDSDYDSVQWGDRKLMVWNSGWVTALDWHDPAKVDIPVALSTLSLTLGGVAKTNWSFLPTPTNTWSTNTIFVKSDDGIHTYWGAP